MKRIILSVVIGAVAGLLSIGLALLPNAFNPTGTPTFNRNLALTWFLGSSLQGLTAAILLAAARERIWVGSDRTRVFWAWGLTALLGVLIPAPCILDGRYADGLTVCYATLVGLSSAVFVWAHWSVHAKVASSPRDDITLPKTAGESDPSGLK